MPLAALRGVGWVLGAQPGSRAQPKWHWLPLLCICGLCSIHKAEPSLWQTGWRNPKPSLCCASRPRGPPWPSCDPLPRREPLTLVNAQERRATLFPRSHPLLYRFPKPLAKSKPLLSSLRSFLQGKALWRSSHGRVQGD